MGFEGACPSVFLSSAFFTIKKLIIVLAKPNLFIWFKLFVFKIWKTPPLPKKHFSWNLRGVSQCFPGRKGVIIFPNGQTVQFNRFGQTRTVRYFRAQTVRFIWFKLFAFELFQSDTARLKPHTFFVFWRCSLFLSSLHSAVDLNCFISLWNLFCCRCRLSTMVLW